ncbi:MAG: dockerin type I domain-containing protein, partial [Candidatus Zixiibacteriota bacterium]
IIAPEGPFVIYDEHAVNDALGNNDGFVDCGESITLDMQLQNVGPDTAFNVTATLTTSDAYITITDGTESFGNIPGDFGTMNIADAFGFDVAGSTPDGHIVSFDLAVTGSDIRDTTWTSAFTVTVHAPTVAYVSVSIDDAAGNGNGSLDPGETANVVINVVNNGSADAVAVSGVISEEDTYVTILDDQGYFGTINSGGGTGNNSGDVFVVSADESCSMGHLLTMHLALTGDGGYGITLDFDFVVGDRIVFYFDDFSFDQGWTGLGGTGEWTIGPAVGGQGGSGAGDPYDDHTATSDDYVLGNDLTPTDGAYSASMSQTYWVYSPMLDLSGFAGVQMRYFHWLGVESSTYDHATLQVYNGTAWVTLYTNSSTVDESSWTESFYDLSSYADGNQDFQIRFGIGPTDGSGQYCGWNIDDIELKGYGEIQSGSPQIVLLPEALADSLHLGESTVDTVKVYNTGEVLLRLRFTSPDSWLIFSTDQYNVPAGDSLLLPVTLSTTGLTPGDYSGSLNYSCNDPLDPSGAIPVSMHIYSPDIQLPQGSIAETVQPDSPVIVPFVISNAGPGRLEYEISRLMFNGKDALVAKTAAEPTEPLGYYPSDDKGGEAEPFFAASTKSSGGPDAWGYNWVDSDDPAGPVYEWIDITSLGTMTDSLGDDDTTAAIPIGFDFPFYENFYNTLNISSNGLVTFGKGSTVRTNTNLPNSLAPNNLIAVWWDDLDPRTSGHFYYYHDVANERFIVSFIDIRNYASGGGTGSLTFQAILYPNGKILLQYDHMDPGTDAAGLAGSTIGIENSAGTDGLPVVYDAAYMHDDLAVLFTAASWLTVDPGSGMIDPFSSDTIMVGFDAAELIDGDYNGQLTIASNDPDTPELAVPVTMTVQGVLMPPPSPSLTSPADGATDVSQPVVLDWEDVTTATQYEVQVDVTDAFTTAVKDTSCAVSQCQVTGLDEGVTFFWRVRAQNEAGWGDWCACRNFTTEITWVCGDANADGSVNILDVTYIIAYLYRQGPAPDPLLSADVDGSGGVTILDVNYLITYIYRSGPAPHCQ